MYSAERINQGFWFFFFFFFVFFAVDHPAWYGSKDSGCFGYVVEMHFGGKFHVAICAYICLFPSSQHTLYLAYPTQYALH